MYLAYTGVGISTLVYLLVPALIMAGALLKAIGRKVRRK